MVLGLVDLTTRVFQPLDTMTVGESSEFSWSPDGRMLAFSKPTSMEPGHHGEEAEADLWLLDVSGARCRLVQGRGFLASNPRWLDLEHIQYVAWHRPKPEGERRVIKIVPRQRSD
jgi:hypothetical protein